MGRIGPFVVVFLIVFTVDFGMDYVRAKSLFLGPEMLKLRTREKLGICHLWSCLCSTGPFYRDLGYILIGI